MSRNDSRLGLWINLALLLACGCLLGFRWWSHLDPGDPPRSPAPAVGDRFDADPIDGLRSLDQNLLVVAMSPDCPACASSLPFLDDLVRRLGPGAPSRIWVLVRGRDAEARSEANETEDADDGQIVRRTGARQTMARQMKELQSFGLELQVKEVDLRALGFRGVPTWIVLDADDTIRYVREGALDAAGTDSLAEALETSFRS